MNLHLPPPVPHHAPPQTGRPGAGAEPGPDRLDQLDPVATHALRLLRLWSWGAVHRETLALAAATQFGSAQGICVVGAFEGLFTRLETTAAPPLAVRQPDSARLDPDERWFLGLVATARAAAPDALGPRAAGRVTPGTEAALAVSLHGFVATLTACLAHRIRPRAAPCPRGCPMHAACTEATAPPALTVVR